MEPQRKFLSLPSCRFSATLNWYTFCRPTGIIIHVKHCSFCLALRGMQFLMGFTKINGIKLKLIYKVYSEQTSEYFVSLMSNVLIVD